MKSGEAGKHITRHPSSRPRTQQASLTREDVVWAYRILLDREPESEAIISARLSVHKSTQELRADIMSSPEFRLKNPEGSSYDGEWRVVREELDRELTGSARVGPAPPCDVIFPVEECRGQPRAEDTDGLPIPPAELISSITGSTDILWFLRGGLLAAHNIMSVLRNNGLAIRRFHSILDFGCGCGRVIRHLKHLERVGLHGTDYNTRLIDWCKENLDFARLSVNDLAPPLCYDDSTFDFVYALSVFTHLPEPLQKPWMSELKRVLRPGGYLLMTTHGEYYLRQLTPDQQQQFRDGRVVVLHEESAGTNVCGAFHPEQYVRNTLAEGFRVVDFVPQGATGNPHQDVFLLKKAD